MPEKHGERSSSYRGSDTECAHSTRLQTGKGGRLACVCTHGCASLTPQWIQGEGKRMQKSLDNKILIKHDDFRKLPSIGILITYSRYPWKLPTGVVSRAIAGATHVLGGAPRYPR